MAQVPQRVLSWLWSVLQTYQQTQLAYSDIAVALSAFPSLQPRTAPYTFEDGHSALLLCLGGTLPVDFRGAQYRFPVEIWVPQEYGARGSAVIGYVKPDRTKDGASNELVVRPGQHVAHDGRIYHPYLRDWNSYERSSIVEFLRIAQQIFAKEPPIVSRQPNSASSRSPAILNAPQPPRKEYAATGHAAETPGSSRPPPLPAKPGQEQRTQTLKSSKQSLGSEGPPLPPLPHQRTAANAQGPIPGGGPPLPPLPAQVSQYQQAVQPNGQYSPVSPVSNINHAERLPDRYQSQPPLPPPQSNGAGRSSAQLQQTYQGSVPQQALHGSYQYAQQHSDVQHSNANIHHRLSHEQQQQQYYQQYQQNNQHVQPATQREPPGRQKPAPPPDLLTDPFDVSLSTAASAAPPPPIPPNPEKEHLLSILSQSLVSQIHAKLQQNTSALAPLQAQHAALQEAQARMNAELAQLQSLDSVLSTNEAILHQSLRDCDTVTEVSAKTPAPNIDEVLVAPTVAANQLWNLCAEGAAIKETIYCLQRALDAGRLGGTEFVRLTRGLAREAFLKMALARKIAKGLGLELGPGKEDFLGI